MDIVPVAEDVFEITNDGPRLIGTACSACGSRYFPMALSCRNPECVDKTISRDLLPDRGTLFSYTIQRYRPPALFQMDDWAPYAIGLVDLGDGLRVMGMLTGVAFDDLKIGMPLRLVIEPLFTDPGRGTVDTYKFAPISDGAAA